MIGEKTMKAMIIEDYCDRPDFKCVDMEIPHKLEKNEVLVRMEAASVNPIDYKVCY